MTDKLILGAGCVYDIESESSSGLNKNVIVCGGSGSGKTTSVIEPRLLHTFNSSLLVTVTKRRVCELYKQLFKDRGYDVLDLNFADPGSSDVGFDPLRYVHSYQDIAFLADAVCTDKANSGNLDPYWHSACVSLLSAEIAFVMMLDPLSATFADVIEMHNNLHVRDALAGNHVHTDYDDAFISLSQKYPGDFAYDCWQSFRQLPGRTANCVFGMLNTALDNTFSGDIRNVMRKEKSISFKDLGERKCIMFVTTSPVNPALSNFINLFYGDAVKELFEYAETFETGRLPVDVSILCDDFATGGTIPNFSEYISVMREKGISVTMLLQSESQLSSIYGQNAATTIIDNCDSYVYLGSMDLKTAENMSTRANEPLDEILSMPVGQEIVFRRGQKPQKTTRYNLYADKEYKDMLEKNNNRKKECEETKTESKQRGDSDKFPEGKQWLFSSDEDKSGKWRKIAEEMAEEVVGPGVRER